MSRSLLRGTALAIAVIVASSDAFAAEVLKYKNGDLVPGDVVLVDDTGVVFDREVGGKIRVAWEKLHPISRYELWESTLATDDADARVALAQWSLGAGLFHQARREALKAQGLGYTGAADLEEFLGSIDGAEADIALAEVDELVAAGKPQEALERVKRYLRVAAPGDHTKRVRARVPDLVARIEKFEIARREAEERAREDRRDARKQDWIDKHLEIAKKGTSNGARNAIDAFAYVARGNQSRSRAALSRSHDAYTAARKTYRRVKRAVGAGQLAEHCEVRMLDIDRRNLEVLRRWATLEVGNKAWKRASPLVDSGLKVDPVDRELLELRKKIDENWIRRKLSGITNASGRTKGGGSAR